MNLRKNKDRCRCCEHCLYITAFGRVRCGVSFSNSNRPMFFAPSYCSYYRRNKEADRNG